MSPLVECSEILTSQSKHSSLPPCIVWLIGFSGLSAYANHFLVMHVGVVLRALNI